MAADLQASGGAGVLYLEGRDDPHNLAALLGLPTPQTNLNFTHDHILVVGLLASKGSGSHAVKRRVELAKAEAWRIQGVVDGDGLNLADPGKAFDQAPEAGACWVWPTWCLENMLALAAWPEGWGPVPDWQAEMAQYAPEVSWNLLTREAKVQLPNQSHEQSLTGFLEPTQHAWRDPEAIQAALTLWVGSEGLDQRFLRLVSEHQAACLASLEEAHARTNGKWLWKHFAPWKAQGQPTPQQALRTWRGAVHQVGGLASVKDWWQRMRANF